MCSVLDILATQYYLIYLLGRLEQQFRKASCFTRDVYFVLFRHKITELAWPIAMTLGHMIDIWLNFIMQVQKFGGPPLKNFGAKNMQNFGQFYTTSDFDPEYLRND